MLFLESMYCAVLDAQLTWGTVHGVCSMTSGNFKNL